MKHSLQEQISTAVDHEERDALKRVLREMFTAQLRRRTLKAVLATIVAGAAVIAIGLFLLELRLSPAAPPTSPGATPFEDLQPAAGPGEEMKKDAKPSARNPASEASAAHETISVRFGSDRVHSDNAEGAIVLANDVALRLWYGTCDVSIPAIHKVGELERPAWWRFELHENPDHHVMLLDVNEASRAEFIDGLRRELAAADRSSLLIFIHGYNVSFEDAARRTAQLAYDLEFRGVPLFFDWASAGNAPAYTHDLVSARESVPHLVEFLEAALDTAGTKHAYLIAHSMGNEVLAEGLRGYFETHPQSQAKVQEIVLAAPDIDARIFREQIAPRMAAYAIPVTMYVSATDKALQVSRGVWGQPRAGDAKGGVLVLSGVETIDATDVDTSFLGHSYIADERTLLTDLAELLLKRQRAADRYGLRPVDVPEGRYWRFKR